MAKYDSIILKFLNQNTDRAPTLITMMTRLKIDISALTDSLSDLMAQGLIAKHTDEQGMERWFIVSKTGETAPAKPASAFASTAAPGAVASAQPDAPASGSKADGESASEAMAMASAVETRENLAPVNGLETVVMPAPQSEPVSSPDPVSAAPAALASSTQPYAAPYFTAPARQGIGLGGLLFGLALTAAVAVGIGVYLGRQDLARATKDFVDQKSFADMGHDYLAFEEKTKAEVNALQTRIQVLEAQGVSLQAAADSLRTALAAAQSSKPAAKGKKKTARSR